jgi:hypothetical protein
MTTSLTSPGDDGDHDSADAQPAPYHADPASILDVAAGPLVV